jgi:dihydrofolate reductase
MTVNGFTGGPKGELDWMTWTPDADQGKYVDELTDSCDCILLGRKMTDGFVSYWTKVISDPKNPEYNFGKKMVDTPKVVFTKTLDKSNWANTVIAKGDLTEEVNKLKGQKGKDIVVYGGALFVSSLIKEELIDEYHLFINPAAINSGLSIFSGFAGKRDFKLVNTIPFVNGVVLLYYEPK